MADPITTEELDEKIAAAINKAREETAKEYEYRIHKAHEEGKAEKDRELEELRAELRKLESEKRGDRIEAWLYQQKEQGKISPVEESYVRALRNWIPDEAEEIKCFSRDGKGNVIESKKSPAKMFEELFENRKSQFAVYSKGGEPEPKNEPLDDPGAELDRQAKLYQAEEQAKGNKVDYTNALKYAMRQDPALAQRYNNSRH